MSAYAFYRHQPNSCVNWLNTNPFLNTATISSQYVGIDKNPPYPPLLPPLPLIVRVNQQLNLPTIFYDITFFKNNADFTIAVIMNFSTQPTSFTIEGDSFESGFISVRIYPFSKDFDSSTDAFVIELSLNTGNLPPNFPNGTINDGDRYSIIVNATCQSTPLIQGVNITFSRFMGFNTAPTSPPTNSQTNLQTNLIRDCGCYNNNTGGTGTVRVPIIDISGQTVIDGSTLSDFTFYIKDKYQYCSHTPLPTNYKECKNRYLKVNKLKLTTYFQFGPPMQDVVKGKGKTLKDKITDYYMDHQTELGLSADDFYEKMIRYGMLKYVLARLLYGEFNIKYLCKNYNKQFFKDLSKSRFCGFIEFFEDSENGLIGFQNYFIKC